jgi:hypothetical protein
MVDLCTHEFFWPRRGADGHYYQACLLCEVEYKYDWRSMRRLERIDCKAHTPSTTPAIRGQERRSWIPRARRMIVEIPVRYRAKGLGTWHHGAVKNLSQSGIFLVGAMQLPENTLVEMVFEMPEEISGQRNSTVLCQGRILRRQKIRDSESLGSAASILNYKFLRQN